MPAPCRVNYPEHRSYEDRQDPEGRGPDAFDDRTRYDGGRRPREEEEGCPENSVEPCPTVRVSGAPHVRAHELAPGHRVRSLDEAADNPRSVGKGEIDPPSEEEESDGDQRDQHRILHQCMDVVLIPRYAHLIHAEPHMDEEHEHDRQPVVELGKNDAKGTKLGVHLNPPLLSEAAVGPRGRNQSISNSVCQLYGIRINYSIHKNYFSSFDRDHERSACG